MSEHKIDLSFTFTINNNNKPPTTIVFSVSKAIVDNFGHTSSFSI